MTFKGKKISRPFAWSYSALGDYETCPAKYGFRKAKVPTPKNPYMERGIEIHGEAEAYLKREVRALPKSLKLLKDEFKELLVVDAIAEGQMAFTRKWEPTGWFADDVWLRVKVDAHYRSDDKTARVIDFKTGRVPFEDKYSEQKRIYAAAGMCHYPAVSQVSVELWYVDHGIIRPDPAKGKREIYTRKSHLRGIQQEFTLRAKRMESDKVLKPRPSITNCKWCDYSCHKGGPCAVAKKA